MISHINIISILVKLSTDIFNIKEEFKCIKQYILNNDEKKKIKENKK